MSTVTYTHAESLDSTAIDEALYNENTRELTLDLDGKYYRYPNVPKNVWEALLDAPSAGRFYRETIKKNYGPAESLGHLGWDDFDEVEVEKSDVINVNVPANRWGVGTPKALVETAKTVITNTANTVYNLTAPVPARDYRKYAVTFEVDGERKTHTLNAESDLDAVASVLDLAHVLGLDFTVKEVTGYFE